VRGMIVALDKIVTMQPADGKVIPGHGGLSTLDDVKKLSATLKDCVKLVEAEVKKKKTLAEVQAAKPLAKYDEMNKGFVKADAFIATLFTELTRKQGATVGAGLR
jgi:cyclase